MKDSILLGYGPNSNDLFVAFMYLTVREFNNNNNKKYAVFDYSIFGKSNEKLVGFACICVNKVE